MKDDMTRSLEVVSELLGQKQSEEMQKMAASGQFGAPLAELALKYAFGDVWDRPGLERKYKSIAVIASLVTSHHSAELRNHIRIGLNNGLTVEEIQEVLIQLVPYVGFPAVSQGVEAAFAVFKECRPESGLQSASERGMI